MQVPEEMIDDDGNSRRSRIAPTTGAPRDASAPPPWRRRRYDDFEGDLAVAELRSRLALAPPDRIPEPLLSEAPVPRVLRNMRLVLLTATAVGIGSAYLWETKLSTIFAKLTVGPANALLAPAPAATLVASQRDIDPPVEARAAIAFAPADTRAKVRPTSANPATSIDAPQQPAKLPPQTDAPPAVIAAKMKIGVELMAYGEIVSARVMFQRAAEAGDGAGAFSLAETYDPLVLEELRLREKITPNVALARTWYERARDLGSLEARDRIARLAQLPQ